MHFLVFAPNPWHGLWRNRQQIFSRLAGRGHRVLYVEPARSSLRDWRTGRVAVTDLRRPALIEEQVGLWRYRVPAWLPIRGTGGAVDRLSDRLLAWHLNQTQRQWATFTIRHSPFTIHNLDNHTPVLPPILWLYRPIRWRWAARSFQHSLLVYHVTDDYPAFGHLSEAERQAMALAEREVLAAANLTLVTAPRLLELKRPHARNIELVPNAVDYEAFQEALANPMPLNEVLSRATTGESPRPANRPDLARGTPPLAPDMAAGPRPILGYSGHISSRLDLALLRELALARPSWLFMLAGTRDSRGCAVEMAALESLPNVHFPGVLPVDAVPHFIAACDVCLIPYRVTEETQAISSLKLYEYLAAGKPVVSAAVPAALEHQDLVQIAEATVESWRDLIEQVLLEPDKPRAVSARQAVAAANTWDQRVDRIQELLEASLRGAGLPTFPTS